MGYEPGANDPLSQDHVRQAMAEWRAERDKQERRDPPRVVKGSDPNRIWWDGVPYYNAGVFGWARDNDGPPPPDVIIPKPDRKDEIRAALVPLGSVKPVLRSRYAVKGWIDRGALSVVYGESNVGKTYLASDMALRIAGADDWHGARLPRDLDRRPVVYIAAEGGHGIGNRIEAFRRSHPEIVARAEAQSAFLLLSGFPLDFFAPNDAAALIEALPETHRHPVLIVVDTLARTMGDGDENATKDMNSYVRSMEHLRRETGAHVMVIHHSGKDSTKGARGSGVLRAAVDTEIEITRSDQIITAQTRKQRDMPTGATFSYLLRSVVIGIDEDGDEVSSAVVEPTDEKPASKPKELAGQPRIALQALSDALAHHGAIRTGDMFPANRQCVTLEIWREYCDRLSLSGGDTATARRTAFHKAKAALQEKGLICIVDGHAWRVSE